MSEKKLRVHTWFSSHPLVVFTPSVWRFLWKIRRKTNVMSAMISVARLKISRKITRKLTLLCLIRIWRRPTLDRHHYENEAALTLHKVRITNPSSESFKIDGYLMLGETLNGENEIMTLPDKGCFNISFRHLGVIHKTCGDANLANPSTCLVYMVYEFPLM